MRLLIWALVRLLTALATMLGVSILIFAAARLIPGSYADLVLGPLANDAQRAAVSAALGLDQPMIIQYFHWLGGALRGDLGTSFVSQLPVTTELAERLPVTITITTVAIALTILIGVPLGLITGTRKRPSTGSGNGRGGGVIGRIVSALGISVPEFVLASVLVFLFSSYQLGLRVGNYVPFSTDPAGAFAALILPSLTLAVGCVAITARTTRDSVMNVLVEPHIAASVGRGESPLFIIRHHVLRNAAIPILTITSTIVAALLSGAVIVESIFNIPGVGSYLVQALGRRDYAVTQAGVLLATATFVIMSLIVDIISAALDPRLKIAGGKGR